MAYKSICYAALHETATSAGAAKAAVDVAADLKAHLTVALGAPQVFAPMLYPSPMLASIEVEVNERERARLTESGEAIRKQAALAGVSCQINVLNDVLYGVYQAIADFTRVNDLTITPAPASDDGMLRDFVVDMVRGSGGPVLLVPENVPVATRFNRILVAWDGGLEASRALRHAMPLIASAESVDIISIVEAGGGRRKPDTLNLAAAHLARHCSKVNEIALQSDAGAMTAIMNQASMARADLIVMGFYGHSRLREWALGGATSDMLRNADRAILVAS